MHARFHAPDLVTDADLVQLPRTEAEHLIRVLRLGPGAEVRVFDGRGLEYCARVETVARGSVTVRIESAAVPIAEPNVLVLLAQAVLKGDAMDEVVRDVVMLGVAAIVPIVSARTEVGIGRVRASGRVGRWQRIAVASVKQCGGAVVPVVHEPRTLTACLHDVQAERRVLLTEPALARGAVHGARSLAAQPAPASVLLVAGPEGGWTDEELDQALVAGCVPVSLGRRTLRAAAAAAVGITVLRTVWGDLEP